MACSLFIITPASANGLDEPRSWILVDHDTGNVIESHNAHERLPPASITKLMTALVVADRLRGNQLVPVSANAERMPAMKINVKQGELWPRDTLLHAALLASANDAAVALAEAASGSLTQFAIDRSNAAAELGLSDAPVFNDPAGLDDEVSSNEGGDLVSARDMAIVARAVLATPELANIVKQKRFDFTAPDGRSRYVINHNKMLDSYPGTIGMKTGYTKKAKNTFVGAATRDGRTMVVVVLGAPSPYPQAMKLLDKGFATPVAAEPTNDTLTLSTLTKSQNAVAAPAQTSTALVSNSALIAAVIIAGFVILRIRARGRSITAATG